PESFACCVCMAGTTRFGQGEVQSHREKYVVPDARLPFSVGCYLITYPLAVTHSRNMRHCMLGRADEEGEINVMKRRRKRTATLFGRKSLESHLRSWNLALES